MKFLPLVQTRGGGLILVVLTFCLLAGCAEQRIRDQSHQALLAGDYESAVRSLEEGVKDHPDSTVLRSGLLQTRAEALSRLIGRAGTARAQGKLDESEHELERARALDPTNERLRALIINLATERRQATALGEAEQWVAKKRPDMAQRIISQGLKDNPHHDGLLALQRRLEVAQRQTQLRAGQVVLSEMRPISLDFRDAPLRTVLDVVSRNSGINFILDRDVRADVHVTVLMRQARVEDALDLLIGTNQLAKKVVDPQTIVIYPNTPEKQREYQEQIVRVFYLASAEAKGAASFLKSMLKIHEPFVEERSNMLALRDSQENIELAERLIALYDTSEPEVQIDVEVMEISSTRLTELGVQFPDTFSLTPLAPDGSSNLTLGNIRSLNRDRIALSVGGLIAHLKRQVGDVNTLANPKIRARNKEKAKILIGDKIPVITTTTSTGGFVSDSVNYLDVGIKLDVEPTVYTDDEVAIKVGLEVSSLGASVKTNSGTLAYQIGTRNAATLLRLRDGETQLLAGLISRDDRSASSRVPGLGDLPVLGRLFSNQQTTANHTELVLAITPHVLRNIRLPDASESELWVGTETLPRLKPFGGQRVQPAAQGQEAAASNAALANAPVTPGLANAQMPGVPTESAPAPTVLPDTSGLMLPKQDANESALDPTPVLKWFGPSSAKVGDTIEVQLKLTSGTALRGMPMQLAFDADKLQLMGVTEAGYFKRDGAATSFTQSGDGRDGLVGVGIMRNSASGSRGSSEVLNLRFKVVAAGSASVRVKGAQGICLGALAPVTTLPEPLVVQLN